jgi:ubiquinol-cytochrome c reductase cytochrome b subunit
MKIIDNVIAWLDERTGLKDPIMKAVTHPVPPGSKWLYVFGTAIMTSFIIQVITGIALSTLYVPSAGQAYMSIQYISNEAPFGRLIRGMHYFGASAMILFTGLHMIRVYLMGSFKYPREFNWLTGVALLLLTVAMGFTGQILRWDQNSVWTVAVGAQQALRAPFIGKYAVEMLVSGAEVGSATLSHFFTYHVFLFPAILIGAIGLHVWMVLHNGISEPPVVGELVDKKTYKKKYEDMLHKEGRPFWPDAAWRDIVFSTLVVVVVLALAVFVGPPQIEKPPDPSIVQAQPKPDWYLLWYFALLALLPHEIEDYVIILFPLIGILFLLSPPFFAHEGERSPRRRPWAVLIVICIVSFVGALTIAGFQEPWTPNFDAKPIGPEVIGATSGPVYQGAQVFNDKGCLYCHSIAGHGGQRGPDLTYVADRLTKDQLTIRIVNGGYNMPAYAGNITPGELDELTKFLATRKNTGPAGAQPTKVGARTKARTARPM